MWMHCICWGPPSISTCFHFSSQYVLLSEFIFHQPSNVRPLDVNHQGGCRLLTSIHLHPRHTTVATIVSCPNVQICRLFPLERWRDSPDAYFRQGGGGLSQSVDTVVVVFVGWSAPLNQGSHFVKDPSLGLSQQNGNCRLNSEKHMFYSG